MRKQLILGLALVLVLSGCSALNQDQGQKDQENQDILTTEEAKTKAKKFIDNNLLAAGQSGSEITNVTEEKGLYKMKVKVGNQSIDSYMTKDGSKFFPQVVDMDKSAQESNNNSNNQQQQQQQQQTSIKDQANAMVQQGNMLLQEAGDQVPQEERQNLEQKINELEEINNSDDPDSQELQTKMQEVQSAAGPLLDQVQTATQTPANSQE